MLVRTYNSRGVKKNTHLRARARTGERAAHENMNMRELVCERTCFLMKAHISHMYIFEQTPESTQTSQHTREITGASTLDLKAHCRSPQGVLSDPFCLGKNGRAIQPTLP